MKQKEIEIVLTIIKLVEKRYQKDADVHLICGLLRKILTKKISKEKEA